MAPVTVNDQSQLLGLFKNVYAKKVVDAYAFMAPLASRLIQYDYQESGLGNTYNQPVDLQLEHSFTNAAAGTVPTYLAINAGKMENATAEGAQIFGRSSVSYEAISRAAASGPKAFESATKRVVKRLSKSHLKRLEMQLICGRKGLGVCASISGTSTTRAIVLSDDSWSTGRWAGMVNATLSIVRANNSTPVAPVAGAAGSCYVTSVDAANKTINIFGNSTDLTDLDTYAPLGAIVYLETGSATTEIAGLEAWGGMSGTWYNIATGTYDLWNSNVYSTSTGTISFGKLVEASSMMAPYGEVERICAVIPIRAWDVLMTDIAALRQYTTDEKSVKLGASTLTFRTQVAEMEILAHPFQSDGKIQIFAPDEALRTGSTDITFIHQGGSGEQIILQSATTPAGEMRTMSNQQLFLEQPRHLVVMSGITYG